ncbi:MAG: hypothetical protein M3406_12300 [Chloroflexota bacterium]|nr:hypothetical protein [Chloroflexota bacterium]
MRLAVFVMLTVGTMVCGWFLGTEVGLLVGIGVDRVTANDWVSNTLLTIPLFGFIGTVAGAAAGVWIARRITRPPPG